MLNPDLETNTLAGRIDALLPQTQCQQCGYAACRPYAEAIANGKAEINQCPPGGASTIQALAALLDCPTMPLNPANGVEQPPQLARIDEAACIGCTLCIQACPVDAIVGAAKLMHTVIEQHCTGCELCLPPCPVDCIRLEPVFQTWPETTRLKQWMQQRAEPARRHYQRHLQRLPQKPSTKTNKSRQQVAGLALTTESKQAVIAAARARAKAKRATRQNPHGY